MANKFFFSEDTYEEKIRSLTHLRFYTLQIWKSIIFLLGYIIVCKLSQNYYLSHYLLNDISLSFSILTYVALIILLCASDYLKMLCFQNYEHPSTKFELVIKLIFEPKENTLSFFLNFVIPIFSLRVLKQCSNFNSKLQQDRNDDVLVIAYGIFHSIFFLWKRRNYKWPKLQINRVDSFKACLKKCIKKTFTFVLMNLMFGIVYQLSFTFSYREIYKNIRSPMFIEHQLCIIFLEIVNYISFTMIKSFICAPINIYCKEIKIKEEFPMIKCDFKNNTYFLNLQYLQNLISVYDTAICSLNTSSNVRNVNYLVSKETLLEMKSKIECISNKLQDKIKLLNLPEKDKSIFMRMLNFDQEEIFQRMTSFPMIDLLSKLITSILILFTKLTPVDTEAKCQFDITKAKYISHQYSIIYLFESLINLENQVKSLYRNEKYSSFLRSNSYIRKQLKQLEEVIDIRISYLVKLNFREKFLVYYGENIRKKLEQYV